MASRRLKTSIMMSTILLAGMAVALGSAQAANPVDAVSPTSQGEARLEALVQKYVVLELEDDDRSARAFGRRASASQDGRLADVSTQAFEQDITSRRALLREVNALAPSSLTFDGQVDRRLLIGLLEASSHMAEAQRMWTIDPAIYLPAAEVGRILEPTSPGTPAEKRTALNNLLAQIPARLAEARRNLTNPSRSFTEEAIFKTEGTIKLLEANKANAEVPAYRDGLAAMKDYVTWLRETVLPSANGSWVLGKANYEYSLRHRWRMDSTTDEILARGQKAFAETEAQMEDVARRIDPAAKNWADVYERLKADHPAAADIKKEYQAQIDAARAFVIAHKIVTLPAGENVITIDTPPALRGSTPFGTFQSVDPFGTSLQGRLVLTPIEEWLPPAEREERLRAHHRAWIPIIAAHEAYPGHHVDGLKRKANARLLRKMVREPIMSEGWGLFTEQMMFEQGFLHGDDVRLAQLRNRLWRAARVILDVKLHTGQMTFDQAVDFMVDKVHFDRRTATLDVTMYTHRPTYVLGYLIGMQEIAKMRADYIAEFGEPSPPSDFYDRLLEVGAIPPAYVRELLFTQKRQEMKAQPKAQ